jgi:hypothetical protein|tara:strand:+ start:326 stop:622 length:297 start_codon:yes stop_codon:yes gene_type:complete
MVKEVFDKKELANSNRIFKSATPKYTIDWYVKWTASFFILISMSMRGIEGLQFIDLCFSLIGVTGWCIVGVLWKDRALILLNGVGVALLLRTLFGTIV